MAGCRGTPHRRRRDQGARSLATAPYFTAGSGPVEGALFLCKRKPVSATSFDLGVQVVVAVGGVVCVAVTLACVAVTSVVAVLSDSSHIVDPCPRCR